MADMLGDVKLNKLRGYPKQARYAYADLRKSVHYLPWHQSAHVRKAERTFVLLMKRTLASWRTLADELGRTPMTTLRNVIASADKEDLPMYRLALCWARRNDITPFNEGFEKIEEALPAGESLYRIMDSVLFHKEQPAESDILEVFREDPKRLVRIILENYRSHSLSFCQLLWTAIDLCGKKNAASASAALGVLMEIRRRRKLQPWMDKKDLASLPVVWRRAILLNPSRRSAFLKDATDSTNATDF
jgi:hypothetical protein